MSDLASQCLAFCQTLASQGRSVSLSLKVGSNFAFSLDTKDSEKIPASKERKKLSPSTQKRNARTRQKYLASKVASTSIDKKSKHDASVLELQEAASKEDGNVKAAPSCDICGHETKTENGIKLHKKKKHQINQIDGNSTISEEQALNTLYEEKTTQTDVFLKID